MENLSSFALIKRGTPHSYGESFSASGLWGLTRKAKINVPIEKAWYHEKYHLVVFNDKDIERIFCGCEIKKILFSKKRKKRGWYNIIWRNICE